jgi:hypothetical protein
MTTVAFAQDWNADSRTRIDMSGDNDRFEGAQRATLGVTFGGSDWGIHSSTEVNYDLNAGNAASLEVYEAYASTDLMGYASMTVGRQALEYGSGMIVGSNQWGDRVTRDAWTFGLDLSMADVTLGYAARMDGAVDKDGTTGYWLNASKAEGDWSANLLYLSSTQTNMGVDEDATTMMGLDLSYAMMSGALNLNVMYNTASDGTTDQDMNMIGASYNVNDDMSVSVSQTTYGENGFNVAGGNAGAFGTDSWVSHGNIGHLGADQKNIAIGGAYAMGDFNFGATMHTVTSDADNAGDYERKAVEMSLGYAMNDNVNLTVNYATDNYGGEDDSKYTWLTLTVTP